MPAPTHKLVLSLRQVRIASTRGHVVIVEPNVPTQIPAALFLEAAKCGCVDYNPEMIEAFKRAMANAAAAAEAPAPTPVSVPAPVVAAMSLAKDAVRQVLTLAGKEPELLTSQGLPRLPAVRAVYEELCSENKAEPSDVKVTTDLIGALYLEIQEETQPEPAQPAARYPAGVPEGDLDEEVGGVEDALSRVNEQQE